MKYEKTSLFVLQMGYIFHHSDQSEGLFNAHGCSVRPVAIKHCDVLQETSQCFSEKMYMLIQRVIPIYNQASRGFYT